MGIAITCLCLFPIYGKYTFKQLWPWRRSYTKENPSLFKSKLSRRAGYLWGVVTRLPCEYLCRQVQSLARFPTLTHSCLIYAVVQVENYTIFLEQLFKVDLVETLCNSFPCLTPWFHEWSSPLIPHLIWVRGSLLAPSSRHLTLEDRYLLYIAVLHERYHSNTLQALWFPDYRWCRHATGSFN